MNYQAPQIKWKTEQETETDGFCSYEANTATHKYRIYYSDVMKSWMCTYYRFSKPETKHKYLPTAQELKEWVETTHYPSALIKAGFKPVSEPLSDTLKWFELAVPKPTLKSQMVQIGCHFEEVAEMMVELGNRYESLEVDNLADYYKNMFTDSEHIEPLSLEKGIELLDSLCDQIVTASGVGYMFGFDMKSALAEVVRSNWSKFENGKPVFDDNGKIKKGANYTPPQLGGFI